MSMLTREELLLLEEGTTIYTAYPNKVYKCELLSVDLTEGIWGNFPTELSVNLSGIGVLFGEECIDLYLNKEEALLRAEKWEVDNRKCRVDCLESEYKKALSELDSPVEVDYEIC